MNEHLLVNEGPGQTQREAPKIELPFKPFTMAEVKALSGCCRQYLDTWVGNPSVPQLRYHVGLGVTGLDFMQTFGLFVGQRFADEGSGDHRAFLVCRFVASMTSEGMGREIEKGRSFPAVADDFQRLTVPPRTKLGRTLNLKVLWQEFQYRVRQVFPKG